MKKHEIQVGGIYTAKVSGRLTTVRVDAIREYDPSFGGSFRRSNTQTRYDVTNLATGRRTTFRSAAKFRSPAKQPKQTNVEEVTGRVLAGEQGLKVGYYGDSGPDPLRPELEGQS